MISRVNTIAFHGIIGIPIDVQIVFMPGKMGISIVGLPDKTVAESRERVQSALHALGFSLPPRKIVINLAPADLPKEGSHYDLPIALGLLQAMNQFPQEKLQNAIVLGELSLDGSLQPVVGILPAAKVAYQKGGSIVCPAKCSSEAAWMDERLEIIAADHLGELIKYLRGEKQAIRPEKKVKFLDVEMLDLVDVKGQYRGKRALEIAAAGEHNLLFIGPPGSGKSMLAQRLPSLLPKLEASEFLENLMIASISGSFEESIETMRRPFRSPHHSATMAAMIGGGQKCRPGEVSLAHNGVLFLDELPEFAPRVLDSLRQLLESGKVLISRADYHVTYPSKIQLIAAMNPCRCGMAGEEGFICRKGGADRCIQDYQSRISGPFLDRMDLEVDIPTLKAHELMSINDVETSATVAERVQSARERQKFRYKSLGLAFHTNGACLGSTIEKIIKLDRNGKKLLEAAYKNLSFSARAFHRIMKVSRTLADLDQQERVKDVHIAEAIAYRTDFKKRRNSIFETEDPQKSNKDLIKV